MNQKYSRSIYNKSFVPLKYHCLNDQVLCLHFWNRHLWVRHIVSGPNKIVIAEQKINNQ